jgi:hypothetical protein
METGSTNSSEEMVMEKVDELVDALTALDETTFSKVYVDAVRKRLARDGSAPDPPPGADRDQFANWLARRHLISDVSINKVIYFPTGSPENEIRFLEVNSLLNVPDPEFIEPLNYSPDIRGFSFALLVADVSDDQWEHVKAGRLALPEGWRLEKNVIIGRK